MKLFASIFFMGFLVLDGWSQGPDKLFEQARNDYYNFQYTSAIQGFERAKEQFSQRGNIGQELQSRYFLLMSHFELGNTSDALDNLFDGSDLAIDKYGDGSSEAAYFYIGYGKFYHYKESYDTAKMFYRSALELKNEKSEPVIYGEIYANLGYACDYNGEYDSALMYYQKAADIMVANLGLYHPYTQWIYASIPFVANHSANFEAEVAAAKKSLEITLKIYGKDNQDHLTALRALAVAYEHSGDATNQRTYFEEHLALTKKLHGEKSEEYATALSQLGNAWSALNSVDKAAAYNQQAYELRKKLLGEKHPETLNLLRNIGNVYFDGGQYANALTYYQKNLDYQIKEYGKKSEELIQPLLDVAQCKENLGQFDEALSLYHQALPLQNKYQSENTYKTYAALARVADERSEFKKALDFLDEALLANLRYNNGDLASEAFIKNNIGTVQKHLTDYEKALDYYDESLEVRRSLFGDTSVEVAQTMFNQANIYYTLGQYGKALNIFEHVLQIEKRYYGEDHPQVAKTMISLASVLARMDKRKAEVSLLRQAEQIQLKANGAEAIGLVSIYNNLAIALSDLLKFEEAYAYNQKHKTLVLKLYGEESEQMADHYNVLAIIKQEQGNINEAFRLYKNAAKLLETIYPTGNEDLANVYNNIGVAYLEYQEYSKSKEYLEEALRIYQNYVDESHYNILTTKMNLGLVEDGKFNYPRAIELFKETIKTGQEKGTLDSLTIATTYLNLGNAYKMNGQIALALNSYEQSLDIRKVFFKEENIQIAGMYASIANIYLDQNNWDESKEYFERAEKIYAQNKTRSAKNSMSKLYLGISDLYARKGQYELAIRYSDLSLEQNDQGNGKAINTMTQFVALVQKVDYSFIKYLTTSDSRYLDQSTGFIKRADEVLKKAEQEIMNDEDRLEFSLWKTLLTNVAVKNALAKYQISGDTEDVEDAFYFAERSKANVLISALQESNVRSFSGIDQQLVDKELELTTRIRTVQEELFKLSADPSKQEQFESLNSFLFGLNREYETIINELRVNKKYNQLTGTLEIVTISEVQQELLSDDQAIVEFAASDSTLHVFLITKNDFKVISKPYDEKFDQLITAIRNAILIKSKSAVDYVSGKLYDLALSDVEHYIRENSLQISRLTIVPEGPFNYFPFEALKRNGRYLIEDYDIQYSYSLTLSAMLNNETGHTQNNSLLAMAPVFSDPSTSALTSGARDVFMASRAVSTDESRAFSINGEFITPLPGTKFEVDAINDLVKQKGRISETLVFEQANEEVIKSGKMNKYQYIHFATHGFVNEAAPAYSGVFMSQSQESEEDCILFASEIYGLEMNADLVTLSACETGLGKFAYGEGIVGLTRAFLYAGAKNLLVSQWKVSDESTARMMVDFYSNMLSGKSKAAALREAKLSLIRDEQFNQPYFWAPFVLIGN